MKTALFVATLLVGIASTAAAQGGQRGPVDPRNRGGGNCSANPYNCADTPNPLMPPDTVWMEDVEALLTDMARSYKTYGFDTIVFIGDSGGNQTGMKNVADKLNAQWNAKRPTGCTTTPASRSTCS